VACNDAPPAFHGLPAPGQILLQQLTLRDDRREDHVEPKKDAEGCVPSASALSKTGVWCVILFGCGVFYMFLGCGVCKKTMNNIARCVPDLFLAKKPV
jgi:hypothetical protein